MSKACQHVWQGPGNVPFILFQSAGEKMHQNCLNTSSDKLFMPVRVSVVHHLNVAHRLVKLG